MDINTLKQLFSLAQLTIVDVPTQIENKYWPYTENYREVRENSPWWSVPTELGVVVIGWRKRVIDIDWSQTNRRGHVTTDDVTKSLTHVHAWGHGAAITYLSNLRYLRMVRQDDRNDEVVVTSGAGQVKKELEGFVQHAHLLSIKDPFTQQRALALEFLEKALTPETQVEMETRSSDSGYYHEIRFDGMMIIIGAGKVSQP